jgi:hypothetical protein
LSTAQPHFSAAMPNQSSVLKRLGALVNEGKFFTVTGCSRARFLVTDELISTVTLIPKRHFHVLYYNAHSINNKRSQVESDTLVPHEIRIGPDAMSVSALPTVIEAFEGIEENLILVKAGQMYYIVRVLCSM